MPAISKANFDFLEKLKMNNNREWFNTNKDYYSASHQNTIDFADALLEELKKHDHIETPSGKKSLFRIYKDTRFSKDKAPYKTHWGSSFSRATKLLRGGYYVHIEPNNCFVGGGFWNPNSEDLKRIREEIAIDANDLRKVINSKTFKQTFGELIGDKVKTAPKGFHKDHPDIDLLRFKQFLLVKKISDKEVFSENFHLLVNDTFKAMRPFFNYMSEVLTTDSNGESIV